MSWLSGWSYRKSHVINYAAGAGTLYQKMITAHYGSGTDSDDDVYLNSHCRTDFGDIRFTDDDGVTLLDYWMEKKVDSDYAVFWVEVADDLSTVDQTIYIYYDASTQTTTSNGADTFLLFDDFNRPDNATVGGEWTEDEDAGVGALNISLNLLKIVQYQHNFCHIEKASPALSSLALHGKIRTGTNSGFSWYPAICFYWGVDDWVQLGWMDNVNWRGQYNKASTIAGVNVAGGAVDTWYFYRIKLGSGTVYLDYSTDGLSWTTLTSITRPTSWAGNPALVIVGKGDSDAPDYPNPDLDNSYSSTGSEGTHYADDVFVRKFVDPEPAHGSWGSEETGVVKKSIGDGLTFVLV